jgi:cobalt/nickel transport system permease protein
MIPAFLLRKETFESSNVPKRIRDSFIDKTLKHIANFISSVFFQWEISGKSGFLQRLDSRTKVIFMFIFIMAISLTQSLSDQLIIAALLLILCLFSAVNLFQLYKKVLPIGFLFGFLIFLPAALSIFTKGHAVFTLIRFDRPYHFWIYNLPAEITITSEGIRVVATLTMRVINSVSLVLLIVSTTTFEQVIQSLAYFKVPQIFILTLTLTYNYVFLLSNTIIETYRAIKMRWWNRGSTKDAEEIIAGRIGFLFRKSMERNELIYQSMLARGFNGRLNFCQFRKFKTIDYLFLTAVCFFFVVFILLKYSYA